MKKVKLGFYWLFVSFNLLTIGISAQDLNPIRWTIKNENKSVKVGEVFKVRVVAAIEEGWHLYSLGQTAGGPIPTRILVGENQKFKLSGEIESPQPHVLFDSNFNMDTEFYETEAIFTLPMETTKDVLKGKNTLSITTFFQTCNDKTCLPPKTVKLTAEIEVTGGIETVNNSNFSNAPTNNSSTSAAGKNSEEKVVDFDFVDFDGKIRKFSEFKGKVVLLDFWATWCSPCLKDIPKLKVLYDKYKTQGFEILGMDSETIGDDEAPDAEFVKETAIRAKQIVKTRGANWVHANSETAVPIAKKLFDVKALPTKILIDKDGKIVARIGEKDDLEKAVIALMKAK